MKEAPAVTARSRLLRSEALRVVEEHATAALPPGTLMERAGRAAADLAPALALERAGAMLVVVGPGNNGGDALVAARVLRERGLDVEVALLDDPSRFAGDAARAWTRWIEGHAMGPTVDPLALLPRATLVIDGLFGIGLHRALEGKAAAWIRAINASPCPVLALDVPSGLDADTGQVHGVAIEADRTVTFIAAKPGLYTGDGPDHAGDIVIEHLGIDPKDDGLRDARMTPGRIGSINRPVLFESALRTRRRATHKGSFGSVGVVGGNDGMVGAALLAARTALLSGAGRVFVQLLARDGPGFDVVHPELMFRRDLGDAPLTAIAIGPGLGHGDAAQAALDRWIDSEQPIVVDADGLNAIAADAHLFDRIARRPGRGLPAAVLTPHPLEAGRLCGVDATSIQGDRIAAAVDLAKRAQSIVVLKGAGTVIAAPDGTWVINTTGNPGLATGGTGDVLGGLVAALLARGVTPLDAARAGTWLHGVAADRLVAEGRGPVGLTASELAPAIRDALNRTRV